MITLLIVADIRLYRDGLAQLLDTQHQFRVVGTAADSGEAVHLFNTSRPDIVLLDTAMPEAQATARAILELEPEARLVALSVSETEPDFLAAAEAGMVGYVGRQASRADLIAALECAARGEAMCSPRMAAGLLRRLAALAALQPTDSTCEHLTRREREILQLLEGGLSNKEIARRLGIEVATVKNHVHNILDKLQVHRRGEAAARMRIAMRTNRWQRLSAAS